MPRLLDLFCGAGGCSVGYHRAGFDVIGVDMNPQPNYPFEFVQGDALAYLEAHGGDFDAVHASPPCQAYSVATVARGDQSSHPDLVGVTRDTLIATGKPYVIENVVGAPIWGVMLCGTMFGLPVRRHRVFETSFPMMAPGGSCRHRKTDMPFMHKRERAYADAMGCQWMTKMEGRQAIPPAYTEYIGRRMMETCF